MNPAALSAIMRGDLANAVVASTPGGIERQEKEGQSMLCNTDTLPKEIHGATREQLVALGFTFGADVDDVFVSCKLPTGWRKRASEHSMHSDLVDDKGRVRAGIFFKAAFYDRHGDVRMRSRYLVSTYGKTDQADQDISRETFRVQATDADTPIKVFGEWTRPDYDRCHALEAEADAWLKATYPDWSDPLAYWD